MLIYYRKGQVYTIKIKEDGHARKLTQLSNATLQLNSSRSNPKMTITIPPDDEVFTFDIKNLYLEFSL
jgi:hypothetical protein